MVVPLNRDLWATSSPTWGPRDGRGLCSCVRGSLHKCFILRHYQTHTREPQRERPTSGHKAKASTVTIWRMSCGVRPLPPAPFAGARPPHPPPRPQDSADQPHLDRLSQDSRGFTNLHSPHPSARRSRRVLGQMFLPAPKMHALRPKSKRSPTLAIPPRPSASVQHRPQRSIRGYNLLQITTSARNRCALYLPLGVAVGRGVQQLSPCGAGTFLGSRPICARVLLQSWCTSLGGAVQHFATHSGGHVLLGRQ